MQALSTRTLLLPMARAVSQLDDTTFRGVLLRSIAWSVASFATLHVGTVWIIHRRLELHGWLAWGGDVIGSIAASLLTLWLFVPVAAAIGTMYIERIARSVEHRFYPWLEPPNGASFFEQARDGAAVAFKVLVLNVLALVLAVILPGLGLLLGWVISAYAIGRGLFVAVAMRRMSRSMAESLYRANRGVVLAQGALMSLTGYIPALNWLLPVIGVATMVHVLDMALTTAQRLDGNSFAIGKM